MNLIIKDAHSSDVHDIYDLICELENFSFPKDNFTEIYNHNLDNNTICYKIAHYDNIIVGFGSVHIQNLLHHCGKVAEIQELVITEKYQNKNIGKSLLLSLIEWGFQNGAIHCEVTCNTKRKLAKEFYLNNNFIHSHHKLIYYK